MTVNESNAYKYADNYAIVKESTGECVGCEHNEQEAKAIAAYLTSYHGYRFSVFRNSKDNVRAAKLIRNGQRYQVRDREMILKDMGVWA